MQRFAGPIDAALADRLAQLHSTIFAPLGERSWTAEEFLQSAALASRHIWVAGRSDAPTGLAVTQMVAPEAELLTIGVSPHARRQRLATQLLHSLSSDLAAMGVQSLMFEVRADNPPAVQFYRAAGAVQTTTRPNYYRLADGRRVDALQFCIALGQK